MSAIRRIPAAGVPLLIGLMAIGAAATAGRAETGSAPDLTTQGPLHCEIQATKTGGSVSLAAVVHATDAVSGSYSFKVTSGSNGNSSNINQGGAFAADATAPVTLGTVMLGGTAAYNASLSVTAAGATVACTNKTGAI